MKSNYFGILKITLGLTLSWILSGCASPQLHALTGNSNEILEYLSKPNSNINNINATGDTMLHFSVLGQRKDIVRLLLEKGANPNLVSKNGNTPLSYAVTKENIEIATILLNGGADPSLFLPVQGSALLLSVQTNQEKMVDLILSYKPNLNLQNEKGATALLLAFASENVSKRNISIAKRIVNSGADLNIKSQGATPLFFALDLEINDMAEFLIEKGANPNIPNNVKLYPLHIAAFKVNSRLVQRLVDKRADPNAKDNLNTTPLMYAAIKSSLDISKILLSAGADVNAINDQGITALAYAAKEGYVDLVKYLLDKKANPNLGSSENNSLALAKKFNRYEVVSLLEKAGGIKDAPPNSAYGRQGHVADGLKLSATGSGMRVSSSGAIVTNAHVVEGCKDIRVNNASTPLIAIDSVNDLAIVKGLAGSHVHIRNANNVKVGEPVVVVGFPLSGLLGTGIQANTGDVSALSGISNDSRVFQISAPVNPGNSGGPLFDNRGNLIGVVKSKLSATRMLKTTGDIPQNINFAIKSNVLTSFLNVHSVNYKSNSNDRVRNVVDIVDSARDTTVAIECWN